MKYLMGFICGLVVFSLFQFSMASREGEKVKERAQETVEASKEYAVAKREEFETKFKKEFDELSAEIKALREKARSTGSETKKDANEQLTKLESKRDEVARKLKKLSSSSGKAWDRLKEGVEAAWDDLKAAYGKASESFNE